MTHEHGRGAGVTTVLHRTSRASSGEEAEEAAAVFRAAELVGHRQVASELDLRFQAEGRALDRQAISRVDVHQVAIQVAGDVGREVAVDEERRARVDAGQLHDVVAAQAHGHRQVGGGLVVQALEGGADVAALEGLGEAGAQLATVLHVDVGVARALAHTVETTDLEGQALAERAAIGEVDTVLLVVQTQRVADGAAGHAAGLGQEVDDGRGRVGGGGAGRAAADRIQRVGEVVRAREHVGRGERRVADQEHGQAVLMDGHIARAASGDRHTAGRDVGVAFTATGL